MASTSTCVRAHTAFSSGSKRPCRGLQRGGRGPLRVQASTSWDPEGLFKGGPKEGIIERKMFQQRIEGDRDYERKMAEFASQQAQEVAKKRESRGVPEADPALIEFFLDTEAPEMDYEIARCRPRLTPDFFSYLDKQIGLERFSTMPDEDRMAELETLRDYLKEAIEAVETAAKTLAAPLERLKNLLEAKDKKAVLLEMAGNNEIDRALIDLLDQNIEGATEAKQEAAADFMKKVKAACLRYLVTS